MRPRLPAASDRLPPSFLHTWRPTRRQVGWGTIGTAVLGGAVLDARPPGFVANFHDEWRIFRERHVAEDGRVVDDGAGGVTHSEGTGYGLLLASAAEDLGSFERILAWSAHRLRRQDGLHAWRWLPGALDPTPDRNNATDGDLLIAWALQRAARLFGRADFLAGARRIAEQVLSQCAREVGGRLVLLPAAHGFERRDHTMVNPSYYVWPALRDLERLVPGRSWRRLSTDDLSLSDAARFGRWGLPADWIGLPHDPAGPPRPSAERPARFSWDAIRVPLHAAWAGHPDDAALLAAVEFWAAAGRRPVPAWVDLASGQVAPYPGHWGVQAVVALTRAAVSRGRVQPLFPRLASSGSYYEAVLILLSRLAWREGVVDPPPPVEAGPAGLPPAGPTAAERMIRVFRKLGRGLP